MSSSTAKGHNSDTDLTLVTFEGKPLGSRWDSNWPRLRRSAGRLCVSVARHGQIGLRRGTVAAAFVEELLPAAGDEQELQQTAMDRTRRSLLVEAR